MYQIIEYLPISETVTKRVVLGFYGYQSAALADMADLEDQGRTVTIAPAWLDDTDDADNGGPGSYSDDPANIPDSSR